MMILKIFNIISWYTTMTIIYKECQKIALLGMEMDT